MVNDIKSYDSREYHICSSGILYSHFKFFNDENVDLALISALLYFSSVIFTYPEMGGEYLMGLRCGFWFEN